MTLMQPAFLYILVGIILFAIGRYFKDYPTGFLSGIVFIISGLGLLIEPITEITSLMNTGLGTSLIGLGGYILIRGSVELIENK